MRRDQLIIARGWASALRASELVNLHVEDLTVVGDPNTDVGLLVRVRCGKNVHDIERVAVPLSTHVLTCPVRRTIAYTGRIRTGPVFRHIDRHGRLLRRLGARPVIDIVRRAVTEALQHDPAGCSSHSLRAGFVTEARARGVHEEVGHRVATDGAWATASRMLQSTLGAWYRTRVSGRSRGRARPSSTGASWTLSRVRRRALEDAHYRQVPQGAGGI
jgi:integrase